MKKILSVIGALIFFVSMISTVLGASPNYATSTEHWSQLFYDGYIQIKSSYNQNGYHALQGWMRYQNGRDGDTGRIYTEQGKGYYDGNIYSRSKRYYDTLDPFAPSVRFTYDFSWWPHDAGAWPVSTKETK
ncbi:hypothetical protein J9303_20645 [Bacillaceae bacterium Marseille-Q3522]|nr:hypothetical protein [Bacillaceae bacterium Marseille-Q3522]